MPTLLIGANLPDIDVLVLFFGDGLALRRGWTHGILAIVVMPVLLTALMLAWDRSVRLSRDPEASPADPSQLFFLAFVAVLSHPFLDWLNTYGMRWLMPFDGTWFYGDALFIVDPWVWLILLGGVIAARDWWGAWAGRTAVALAAAYVGSMLVMTAAGSMMVREAMEDAGSPVHEVMVGPVPVNPNRRDVVMRRDDTYYRGTLQWLPSPRLVVSPDTIPSNRGHPLAILVESTPQVRDFMVWSRFPFFRIEELGAGYRVIVDDLRYTDGTRPSFAAIEVIVRPRRSSDRTFTGGPSAETGSRAGT